MDKIEVPQVVEDIAFRTHQVPWSWFVAEDHVVIVWMTGHKDRYELPLPPLPPASKPAAAKPAAAAKPLAPKILKLPPRSCKTK
jgi:hypothetical protein